MPPGLCSEPRIPADSVLVVSGTDDEGLVYPNPGANKSWTDPQGRTWKRRGEDWLDDKRIRALLRRDGVPMATWWAGAVMFYGTAEEKQAAANRLLDVAERPEDVVASEWKGFDGTVLLLLEHHC
jgi:hypothetical protein